MTVVLFHWSLALLSTRDAGAYPLVFQRLSEPVSVTTAIPKQPFYVRQTAEQRPRADVIAHLSDCDEQIDRSSQTVTNRMKLGVHAALGATNQVL